MNRSKFRIPHSAIRIAPVGLRTFPHSPLGFTLLELLVVLVIISLMSALIAPKITGTMVNLKLKTASKKVSAALRYARSNAASEKRTYAAAFDLDRNRLSIFTAPIDGGENDEEPAEDEKESAPGPKVYDLPEGIRVEKGVAGNEEVDSGLFQILFFPNGSSSGGDVILANDRGRWYKISVDFITGVVQLGE